MKRQIKFRAYDTEMKIMGMPFHPLDSVFMAEGGTFPETCVFMQFTGLLDRHGVEIYEGDVIRFKVDFPDQEFDNGVVRWAAAGFWTAQSEDDLEDLLSEELNDLEGEVIGNIYANPELLKQ